MTSSREFDPELVVIFSPDHYNGFFYKMMPPFCIGTAATGVGDYGTQTGPLDVPATLATALAEHVLDADVDVAISAGMDVDHGTVQPLQKLFGDATARAGDPDLHQLRGHSAGPDAPVAGAGRRGREPSWPAWTSGCWWWVPVACRMIRRCRPWRPRRRPHSSGSCTASR